MNGKSSASIPGCRNLSPPAPPGYACPWRERQILQGKPGRIDIPPLPGRKYRKPAGTVIMNRNAPKHPRQFRKQC
ncbi:MAG TPA: hypothetical protein DD422_08680 [Akkermansia sp.]|nr:hypothetical protein [Akkermansia sp.]